MNLYVNCCKSFFDILFLQETKLDGSFPDKQFSISGYKSYRKDVNGKSGGLLAYVRGNLLQRRRDDLETACQPKTGRIETILIEIMIGCAKWIYCSMYKQPTVTESEFVCLVETVVDKMVRENTSTYRGSECRLSKTEEQCL